MITMQGLSRELAEALEADVAFKALCTTEIGSEFYYYVNVDLAELREVSLPYFSIVTYNNEDDREVKKAFKTIFLIGIERQSPATVGRITEEPTIKIIEKLTRAAVEVVKQHIRFGVQGESNIKISYINMYVPNPEGEDDLQMQVDIEFEQEKFLGCS